MKDLRPHLNNLQQNMRKKAVAIQYDPEDAAPRIVAKGAGLIAERIMENAKLADVPLHKDAALAEELNRIDLGASIPPELYEVVAQILIFISDLDKNETIKKYTKAREDAAQEHATQ
ncbi:MAG: EscU/YscU/HrcU family type III secretion system export apparatus switch protein [Defluviitaleaceae bacterium]|nr:EscU/YscU/HrcU family type III secretion system export apparatus switch protein [Defluviitaleaceae bacterium]MCL2239398.1 EscU/YscU/HrcU family type III secretion system export apparatus switch protein [Defluviitaleaceae bacterium]